MQVAYVTSYDANDVQQWSGLGNFIAGALRNAEVKINTVGPLATESSRLLMLKKLAYLGLGGQRHLIDREPSVARGYAAQIARSLDRTIDIVFSPGTIPIGYLKCRQPIAYWTDATFGGIVGFYREFSNLSAETLRNGHRLEQAALDNSRLAIYSSDWAARTAREHYRVDPDKIAVVPFGANIDVDFGAEEMSALIDARPTTTCRLLFLGVDWERKGGPVACEVVRQLNEGGLPASLTVVGCRPSVPPEFTDHVEVVGPISKATAEGRDRLQGLLAAAHFLIMPSRADCTPVVFSEANAFGVPCLTSDIGGIPSIVLDGVNGYRCSFKDEVASYVDRIEASMRRYDDYRALAASAYAQYRDRLNWRVAGAAVRSLLRERCH